MSSPTKSSNAAPSRENVKVVVRCRPLSHDERQRAVPEHVVCDTEQDEVRVTIALGSKVGEKVFPFDRVYDTFATQREIYNETVEPLVQQTLRGFNTTVFAYGQTGTGKTFTMEGDVDDAERMGVIPRAVASIFRTLEARGEANESFVKASYLEIYNENCTDLLAEGGDAEERAVLRVVEDKTRTGRGVIVHGLQEVLVKSVGDIQRVMKQAISKRKTAATELNDQSSRSHAIFTVTVHIKETNEAGEELLKVGKINLVDLAGSECVARSGSKDARAREAGNINQSLLTLGRVITALVEKSPHVPYRDSKLTRLLQESLGGCALTCILATVAPSVQCLDETLSTLEYASRAKSIKNKPVANQKMTKRLLIKEYAEEIERLRVELQAARSKDGVFLPETQYNTMVAAMRGTSSQVVELEQTMEKRAAELQDVKQHLAVTSSELQQTQVSLGSTRAALQQTSEQLDEERRRSEERQVLIEAHVNTEARLLDVHDSLQAALQVAAERIDTLQGRVERDGAALEANLQTVAKHRQGMDKDLAGLGALTSEAHRAQDETLTSLEQSLERVERLVGAEWPAERAAHRERQVCVALEQLERLARDGREAGEWDVANVEHEGASAGAAMRAAAEGLGECAEAAAAAMRAWERAKRAETDALRQAGAEPLLAEITRARESVATMHAIQSKALEQLREAAQRVAEQSQRDVAQARGQAEQRVREAREQMRQASDTAVERIAAIVGALADNSVKRIEALAEHAGALGEQAHAARDQSLGQMVEFAGERADATREWAEAEDESMQRAKVAARAQDERARELGCDADARDAFGEFGECVERERHALLGAEQVTQRWAESTKQVLQDRDDKLGLGERQARAELTGAAFSAQQNDDKMDRHAVELLQAGRRVALTAAVQGRDRASEVAARVSEAAQQVRGLGLREPQASGRTPSRRQGALTWTRDRPQTSPHAKILTRFRRARDSFAGGESEDPDSGNEENVRPVSANVAVSLAGEAGAKEVKLQEVRAQLKEKGLSVVGTKAQLMARLNEAS